MEKYHKIETVFKRDPSNNYRTLLEGEWRWSKPEFGILKDIDWICTEKIDGVNIRVIWDGNKVEFRGKTDNAEIPLFLIKKLEDIFTINIMDKVFPSFKYEGGSVCLYGEGYGKRIQKGDNYISNDVNFILFDIKIGEWWLTRDSIFDIADDLNINIVPIIDIMKLEEAIEYVKVGFKSVIAENKEYIAEGLVMKPKIELFNRRGDRVITKIKYKDF